MTHPHDNPDDPAEATSGWRRFWATGTWWKAILAVVGYLAAYEFATLLVGSVLGGRIDPGGVLGSPGNVAILLLLPLALGAAVLAGFVSSLDWWRPLFGRQPVAGAWWMWILVVLAVVPIALRLGGIDYGRYGAGVVTLVVLAGAFVGFTEELLYRGIVIKLLRDAGHGEKLVAVVSSAMFALSHTVNLAMGQDIVTVGLTVAFTFGFGLLMYVVLRSTGNLGWPMLIHGLTDPTTILAVGGIDSAQGATANPLLALAAPFNIVFVVAGLIAILVITGRATGPKPAAVKA